MEQKRNCNQMRCKYSKKVYFWQGLNFGVLESLSNGFIYFIHKLNAHKNGTHSWFKPQFSLTTLKKKYHVYHVACDGTEAEIQLPLKRSSRFQRLFPNPSWLVWGRASRHQKLAPTFPGIDSCLMVTKRDFLEMEASLWLNGKSQNVAKGWLST